MPWVAARSLRGNLVMATAQSHTKKVWKRGQIIGYFLNNPNGKFFIINNIVQILFIIITPMEQSLKFV